MGAAWAAAEIGMTRGGGGRGGGGEWLPFGHSPRGRWLGEVASGCGRSRGARSEDRTGEDGGRGGMGGGGGESVALCGAKERGAGRMAPLGLPPRPTARRRRPWRLPGGRAPVRGRGGGPPRRPCEGAPPPAPSGPRWRQGTPAPPLAVSHGRLDLPRQAGGQAAAASRGLGTGAVIGAATTTGRAVQGGQRAGRWRGEGGGGVGG